MNTNLENGNHSKVGEETEIRFKQGDWVILKEETVLFLRENMVKLREDFFEAKQVLKKNDSKKERVQVVWTDAAVYIDAVYFRKATLSEIKKQKLKSIFKVSAENKKN